MGTIGDLGMLGGASAGQLPTGMESYTRPDGSQIGLPYGYNATDGLPNRRGAFNVGGGNPPGPAWPGYGGGGPQPGMGYTQGQWGGQPPGGPQMPDGSMPDGSAWKPPGTGDGSQAHLTQPGGSWPWGPVPDPNYRPDPTGAPQILPTPGYNEFFEQFRAANPPANGKFMTTPEHNAFSAAWDQHRQTPAFQEQYKNDPYFYLSQGTPRGSEQGVVRMMDPATPGQNPMMPTGPMPDGSAWKPPGTGDGSQAHLTMPGWGQNPMTPGPWDDPTWTGRPSGTTGQGIGSASPAGAAYMGPGPAAIGNMQQPWFQNRMSLGGNPTISQGMGSIGEMAAGSGYNNAPKPPPSTPYTMLGAVGQPTLGGMTPYSKY